MSSTVLAASSPTSTTDSYELVENASPTASIHSVSDAGWSDNAQPVGTQGARFPGGSCDEEPLSSSGESDLVLVPPGSTALSDVALSFPSSRHAPPDAQNSGHVQADRYVPFPGCRNSPGGSRTQMVSSLPPNNSVAPRSTPVAFEASPGSPPLLNSSGSNCAISQSSAPGERPATASTGSLPSQGSPYDSVFPMEDFIQLLRKRDRTVGRLTGIRDAGGRSLQQAEAAVAAAVALARPPTVLEGLRASMARCAEKLSRAETNLAPAVARAQHVRLFVDFPCLEHLQILSQQRVDILTARRNIFAMHRTKFRSRYATAPEPSACTDQPVPVSGGEDLQKSKKKKKVLSLQEFNIKWTKCLAKAAAAQHGLQLARHDDEYLRCGVYTFEIARNIAADLLGEMPAANDDSEITTARPAQATASASTRSADGIASTTSVPEHSVPEHPSTTLTKAQKRKAQKRKARKEARLAAETPLMFLQRCRKMVRQYESRVVRLQSQDPGTVENWATKLSNAQRRLQAAHDAVQAATLAADAPGAINTANDPQ